MAKEYAQDRHDNEIYITDERWAHICIEHPDMVGYKEHLLETLRKGKRKQDELHLQKYFYTKSFRDLIWPNNHIVVVVRFAYLVDDRGNETANNFVLTAYQNLF
ncbi:hypothetical protein L0244_24125 [bacterium]|nr:hypothetical protein [bacterium]